MMMPARMVPMFAVAMSKRRERRAAGKELVGGRAMM
jgi:hypothetical protein